MPNPPPFRSYSRRDFLQQLLGAGALALGGGGSLLGQTAAVTGSSAGDFRFAFITDLHLMKEGGMGSAAGIAACLTAAEKLDPKPEFILVGGDLVHSTREITIPEAEKQFDLFQKIWSDHTGLPTKWTFGNHDLAGTGNATVSPDDKLYAKGLFKERFQLPELFFSFDHKGWHFVVLDDIELQPDHTYIGKLFDDEMKFLQDDLAAHRAMPTILCTHIPILSNLPIGGYLLDPYLPKGAMHKAITCSNGGQLVDAFSGNNIRAVLCGHLHYFEKIKQDGVKFFNGGAVCGDFWKGPLYGCPNGFGVVDVGADGSVAFNYRATS